MVHRDSSVCTWKASKGQNRGGQRKKVSYLLSLRTEGYGGKMMAKRMDNMTCQSVLQIEHEKEYHLNMKRPMELLALTANKRSS